MNQSTVIRTINLADVYPLKSQKHVIASDLSSYRTVFSEGYKPVDSCSHEDQQSLIEIVQKRYQCAGREGQVISTNIEKDLGVRLYDSVWGAPYFKSTVTGEDWCVLTFRLSGTSRDSVGGRRYDIGPYSCSMVYLTRATQYSYELDSEVPITEACFLLRPGWLSKKLKIDFTTLSNLSPSAHEERFSHCVMSPEIERAVKDLFSFSLFNPAYRLFAEAKSLELIALYLTELQECKGNRGGLTGSNKLRGLLQIKEYLDNSYMDVPKLDNIAKMAGMNRRKLTDEFKSVFGVTVFDYIQQLRMEKAKQLLQRPDARIGLVASELGYDYQGNFSKAFHKYVGLSPRTYMHSLCRVREKEG